MIYILIHTTSEQIQLESAARDDLGLGHLFFETETDAQAWVFACTPTRLLSDWQIIPCEIKLKHRKSGRPKGNSKPHKLEPYRQEIQALLDQGTSQSDIARQLNVNRSSLLYYLKTRMGDQS